MKRKNYLLVMLIILFVFCFNFISCGYQNRADDSNKTATEDISESTVNEPSIERWEYASYRFAGSTAAEVQRANRLGQEGWRLTPIITGEGTVIYERRIP